MAESSIESYSKSDGVIRKKILGCLFSENSFLSLGELQPILGSFEVTTSQAALFAKAKYPDHIWPVRFPLT